MVVALVCIVVILATLVGVYRTYAFIRKAETPTQRKLAIKYSLLAWGLVALLIVFPIMINYFGLIPEWALWILWALCFVFNLLGNRWAKKRIGFPLWL